MNRLMRKLLEFVVPFLMIALIIFGLLVGAGLEFIRRGHEALGSLFLLWAFSTLAFDAFVLILLAAIGIVGAAQGLSLAYALRSYPGETFGGLRYLIMPCIGAWSRLAKTVSPKKRYYYDGGGLASDSWMFVNEDIADVVLAVLFSALVFCWAIGFNPFTWITQFWRHT